MTRWFRAGLAIMATTLLLAVQGGVLFEERFDDALDKGWSWVRPDTDGWHLRNGALSLRVSPGGLFQDHDGGRNILIRNLALGVDGVVVSVELSHRPEGLYENGGIILYEDDDNYIVVNKESYPGHDPPLRLQVVAESDGVVTVPHHAAYDREDVVLGMRIAGGSVTGLYRYSDEDPWTPFGSVDLPRWDRFRIGLKVTYGVEGVLRWAEFDNFRIVSE